MFNLSLDMARALDAVARDGTIAAAARRLGKRPSGVVYALAQLELQAGVALVDRTGYRNRLTPAGDEVLTHCRTILAAVDVLEATCAGLRDGWEPVLRVVVDGVFPIQHVTGALADLQATGVPTRIELDMEVLAGVEATFATKRADIMVSVLRPEDARLVGVPLPPIEVRLLCAPHHPLAARHALDHAALADHAMVVVRGSGPRLVLPTSPLDEHAPIVLHDFHAKRAALLAGLGFGWMPLHLVVDDLADGTLVELDVPAGSRAILHPHAWHRRKLGRAASAVVSTLTGSS